MISPAVATGTNLSSDTYLSVEEAPQAQTCSAELFLEPGASAHTVVEGGTHTR